MKILKNIIGLLGMVFLILLTLFFVSFSIIKHLKIKEIVEREIEQSLGIDVTLGSIEFSPLLAHIGIKGVTIHNPSGFPEEELAYLKSIHFVLDPLEVLTSKKPNIYVFALQLERLNIVKNRQGKVNIKEIIPIKEGDAKDAEAPFYFDMLVLSIGDVTYTDHSSGSAKVHKYHIGIKNATFIGLKDEHELVKMVVYKAIENTEIGKMINLTILPVVSQIKDTMDAAWGATRSGAKSAWGIATLPLKLLLGTD